MSKESLQMGRAVEIGKEPPRSRLIILGALAASATLVSGSMVYAGESPRSAFELVNDFVKYDWFDQDPCDPPYRPYDSNRIDEALQVPETNDIIAIQRRANAEYGLDFVPPKGIAELRQAIDSAPTYESVYPQASSFTQEYFGFPLLAGFKEPVDWQTHKQELQKILDIMGLFPRQFLGGLGVSSVTITDDDGYLGRYRVRPREVLLRHDLGVEPLLHELIGHPLQQLVCDGNGEYDKQFAKWNPTDFEYGENEPPDGSYPTDEFVSGYAAGDGPHEDFAETLARFGALWCDAVPGDPLRHKLDLVFSRMDSVAEGVSKYYADIRHLLQFLQSQGYQPGEFTCKS